MTTTSRRGFLGALTAIVAAAALPFKPKEKQLEDFRLTKGGPPSLDDMYASEGVIEDAQITYAQFHGLCANCGCEGEQLRPVAISQGRSVGARSEGDYIPIYSAPRFEEWCARCVNEGEFAARIDRLDAEHLAFGSHDPTPRGPSRAPPPDALELIPHE